eukprot:1143089-Pelagomonas_calceolata.AAC.16
MFQHGCHMHAFIELEACNSGKTSQMSVDMGSGFATTSPFQIMRTPKRVFFGGFSPHTKRKAVQVEWSEYIWCWSDAEFQPNRCKES